MGWELCSNPALSFHLVHFHKGAESTLDFWATSAITLTEAGWLVRTRTEVDQESAHPIGGDLDVDSRHWVVFAKSPKWIRADR